MTSTRSATDNQRYIEQTFGEELNKLEQFPRYLMIETVSACNARCEYCPTPKLKGNMGKGTIAQALFSKLLEEIAEWKDHVVKVMLYGRGEPLIDPLIWKRVAEFKSRGIRNVNLASNGSLLNPTSIRSMLESGLDEIYLTVDSLASESYRKIKNLNLDRTLSNIDQLLELRSRGLYPLKVRVQMVETEENQTEPDRFRDYWKPRLRSSDQIVITRRHNWGNLIPSKDYADDVNRWPCAPLWSTCAVRMDGVVPICCVDSTEKFVIGNASQTSIARLWNDESFRKYRQMHLTGARREIAICDGCTTWRHDKRIIEHGKSRN